MARKSDEVDSRRVAVAFMAHPDDAEILCAGALVRLREEHRYDVHIITATPGDCGSASLPPAEIAATRRTEGQAAASLIGGVYHCLEERDVRVVFDAPTIQKAIDLFRQINPTLVFTHPRHDYMLDHEQVHLLARAATFSSPIPNASPVALSAGARIPHLYYCDPIEGLDPYTGELVDATTLIDITRVIDRKSEMLACHASQREWLRSYHGMDEYLDAMRRFGARRGQEMGVGYAEGFTLHRGHAYPHDDIVRMLLARES